MRGNKRLQLSSTLSPNGSIQLYQRIRLVAVIDCLVLLEVIDRQYSHRVPEDRGQAPFPHMAVVGTFSRVDSWDASVVLTVASPMVQNDVFMLHLG